MRVQHAVETARLVLVAVDAVGDFLGGVAVEMVGLALHGSDAGVQEEQPVVDFVALARAMGIADEVLGVVLLDEILHYAPRFEQSDCLPVVECIGQSGDPSVGVDGEEPGFFLGIVGDVNGVRFVGDACGFVSDGRESILVQEPTDPSSSRTIEILMPLGVWVV